ncbi:hypothetical protein [Dyella choica]|uniref:Uncharacterized protein n=1 Tax=Dyella choica TaxID=1927959 RepID=A0A432M0K6_9GAMM|nr:hypothetical protein [Dyella choica]RUL70389.1 hypothetical protein EKH80_20700 [Dyella choica]
MKRARSGKVVIGARGRLSHQASHPEFFAGGDNVRDANLFVRAVYDGSEVGRSIASMLVSTAVKAVAEV